MNETERATIDKLRDKAFTAYDKLSNALTEAGHETDCIMRCIEDLDCTEFHGCPRCEEDGEV